MNRFSGHISEVETHENLSLVSIRLTKHIELKTILIDTPDSAPYLQKEHAVEVLFKETEVSVSTDLHPAISLQNRFPGKIKQLEKGKLLSRILIQTEAGEVICIISSSAVESLKLKPDLDVLALIKLNEITLAPL